jgi:hypothetical protein
MLLPIPNSEEPNFDPNPGAGINWPPFRSFDENFYTYQLLRDLTVAGDMAVRNEQHIGLVPIDEEEAAERETLGRVFTPAVAIEPCAGPGFGYCRLPALGRPWHACSCSGSIPSARPGFDKFRVTLT